VYREGVWVRQIDGSSAFDYNFTRDELKIDECRNSSDYLVKVACARKLREARPAQLARVIQAQMQNQEILENRFDEDYLTGFNNLTETESSNWKEAWALAAGSAVVCNNKFSEEFVRRQGKEPVVVSQSWSKAIERAGVESASTIELKKDTSPKTVVVTHRLADTILQIARDNYIDCPEWIALVSTCQRIVG
jgi:hypothetical protein